MSKTHNMLFKRVSLLSLIVLLLIFSLTMLTSCQSTDKHDSYFDSSAIENTVFEYNSSTNKTKITWGGTLSNETIYNINNFTIAFKLYGNYVLEQTQIYNYNKAIKHGDSYTGLFTFYADGKIEKIEYVAWTANYENIWETYKIWFIVMISIAAVASLIYIIIMIVEDLEISDTIEFFEDHYWIATTLIPCVAMFIWGMIESYWVPILIVIGGIIAFVLISLIAHLIKYIIVAITDNTFIGCDPIFDNEEDEFEDYEEDLDDDFEDEFEEIENCSESNAKQQFETLNKHKNVASSLNKKKPRTNISSNNLITFNSIAGLEDAKTAFREKIVYAFEHKQLYEKYGKKVGGGILLYGLPGTGKTMFAEAAANETDALFIPLKCSDIKSKWYGESEANVKKIFAKARSAKKAIIFFDEFEAIGAKRTDNSDNGNNDLVPQILAEMQGIGSANSTSIIIVIAATNKPWAIDSAFLRPGRFDEKVYIPLPDFEARKKMFCLKLANIPQKDLNYNYLANITEGFSGADIGAFCDKLKMLAINKSIASNEDSPITMVEVEQTKNLIKSSVSKEDIDRLIEFNNQYK